MSRELRAVKGSCPECGGPITQGHAAHLVFAVPLEVRHRVLDIVARFGQKQHVWLCALCGAFGLWIPAH